MKLTQEPEMIDKNSDQNSKTRSRLSHGLNLPSISFEEAIELTKITYTKAGSSNSLDALSRITGNSSSSSTFIKKIGALRSYGTFIFDKQNYILSELGEKIAKPESYDEQADAIIQSFLKQENLKKIWETYKGKKLPQEEFLENSIQKILGIPTELKQKWAEYFVEAGKYAGLLEERDPGSYQVLQGYVKQANNNSIRVADEIKATEYVNVQIETPESKPQKQEQRIALAENYGINTTKIISENRKAYFMIPDQLTQQDIDSLKVVIKGIELQIEGLKKVDYLSNKN